MTTLKARRRHQNEFTYTPGRPVTVAPKAGYAGCYVLRHGFESPAVKPSAAKHVYTVFLYIDAAAQSVTFTLNDDGGGIVVDVPEGFTIEKVKAAILEYINDQRAMASPPPTLRDRP